MRVIKYFIFLFMLINIIPAQARDQDWGFFQLNYHYSEDTILMAEWLRRDSGQLFDKKVFDYFRFSYGQKLSKNWIYFLGAGYADFYRKDNEYRGHQFLIYQRLQPRLFRSLNRFALEERLFERDSNLYFRLRIRNQIDPLPQYHWGLSVYNEAFIVPQGHSRFFSGLNENRFGFGPRYTNEEIDLYFYWVETYLRNSQGEKRHQTWGQLQIRAKF